MKKEIWDKIFLPFLKKEQWVIFKPVLNDDRKYWKEYHYKELLGRVYEKKIFSPPTENGNSIYWITVETFDFSHHRLLAAYRSELTPIPKPTSLRLFLRKLRRSLK